MRRPSVIWDDIQSSLWFRPVLFVGWGTFFAYVLVRFRRGRNPQASYHGVRGRWSTWVEGGVLAAEVALYRWITAADDPAVDDARIKRSETTIAELKQEAAGPDIPADMRAQIEVPTRELA